LTMCVRSPVNVCSVATVAPTVRSMSTGERLFTAWFTSSADWVDHAVTDEEFAEHRPEPATVCGAVIMLAPMESPPGRRCPRCVAFLRALGTAEDLHQREPHRHRRPAWLARLLHHDTSTPVVPSPRVLAQGDRHQHPAVASPDTAGADLGASA
jgi:hypothetical protein